MDETPWLADGRIEAFMTTGLVLHGAGIITDRSKVHYALADDAGRVPA